MSLVDKFDTRDFVNGRLIGGNYNEMTGNTTYSDIATYGGKGMAGSGGGIGNDVGAYRGTGRMGGEGGEGSGDFVVGGGTGVINDLLLRPEDEFKSRTMEYRPERDGTFELEQLVSGEGGVPSEPYDSKRTPPPEKPYGEGRDRDGFPIKLAGGFRGRGYGQVDPRRGGLEYMTQEALKSLPNSGLAEEKHRQIRSQTALPGFLKGV